MIEQEFIPYQESLELKELGFNEPCFATYEFRKLFIGEFQNSLSFDLCKKTEVFPAPTFSQVFRWFRDKGFLISFSSYDKDTHEFYIKWISTKSILSNEYKTYEEAELECLRQLIKITLEK